AVQRAARGLAGAERGGGRRGRARAREVGERRRGQAVYTGSRRIARGAYRMAEPRTARWTIADPEALPHEEGTRYELVDGELVVLTQPDLEHRATCVQCGYALETWTRANRRGRVLVAPGLIFSDIDAAAPDLVWVSHERVARLRDAAGHLRGA